VDAGKEAGKGHGVGVIDIQQRVIIQAEVRAGR